MHPSTWGQGGLPMCLVACSCLQGAVFAVTKLHSARCMLALGHIHYQVVCQQHGYYKVIILAAPTIQASEAAY